VAARPAPPPPPRAHVRPPPPKPSGPIVQGPGGVQSVQVTENLQARPSATRAVVLSRPLIPIARPPPRPPPGGGSFRPRPVGANVGICAGGTRHFSPPTSGTVRHFRMFLFENTFSFRWVTSCSPIQPATADSIDDWLAGRGTDSLG